MAPRSAIEVSGDGAQGFRVKAGDHRFDVSMPRSLPAELGAPDAHSLVAASFEFLLEREPPSSILPRFDLTVIERYFPGWRAEMRRRFAPDPRSAL